MAEHSNVYYVREADGTYTPRKDGVGVKNELGGDIFRCKDRYYEGQTGVFICGEGMIGELLRGGDGKAERFAENVRAAVERWGLSPRYTQPEVMKADLFPRDDSKILSRALYHKEKCRFTRVPNENGVELYTMDKEKSYAPTLYTPCKGWMIGIGAEIDSVTAFLTQPGFDLYAEMVKRYEASLQIPNKWADAGIAEFLGRREEADAHNAPIREARDRERREAAAERAEQERLQAEQIRLKYETAIKDAEQAILQKRPVRNDDIVDPKITWRETESKSLILELFRANGITLPLKTQGWVNTALAEICYYPDREDWGYSYYKSKGRESAVFAGYVNQLAAAVEAKYIDRADNEGEGENEDEMEY